MSALEAAVGQLRHASSDLLRGRELLRRVDTKFVATEAAIAALLPHCALHYAVMHGGFATYQSLYFDTPDLRCFHDHRRGRRVRHKVRIRHYPDRSTSFFEIKTKRNELVTDKQRLELAFGQDSLGPAHHALLDATGLPGRQLRPVIRIDYHRLTLAGLDTKERVTIDVGLEAVTLDGARYAMGDVAVIEVKQAPFCARTPMMRALYRAGLSERSMSKYIAAVARLVPDLRCNRLLPALRRLPELRRLPDLEVEKVMAA